MKHRWRIWVDTGGTFTDCIAFSPEGKQKRIKVLSSSKLRGRVVEVLHPTTVQFQANWNTKADIFQYYSFSISGDHNPPNSILRIDWAQNLMYLEHPITLPLACPVEFEVTAHEEAPILAARIATGTMLKEALPNMEMRLGTTKGTNALLERNGADVAFVTTKGFADLLQIGTQQRPNLFSLNIKKTAAFYTNAFEIEERLNAQGEVLIPLTSSQIDQLVNQVKETNCQAVAIALLHSYKNPEHEIQLYQAFRNAGFENVSCSHLLAPSIKILPRANTAVINAYLSKTLNDYLNKVEHKLTAFAQASNLKVMTSAGGLVGKQFYQAKDSLLSGPAGGIIGAAKIAKQSGHQGIITLDMGGTSADVGRFDREFEYKYETKVGDSTLSSPSLAIETVAAGGGSICSFDGFRLKVGPESAGANPGPACYGFGGPLTLTDINLLLGRLDEDNFAIPIKKERAEEALQAIKTQVIRAGLQAPSKETLLEGFLQIANEKMADAIKNISISKGHDPQEHSLLAFGGAGGMHACSTADSLSINNIIVPYHAGLLSAYGIGHAVIERFASKQILRPLQEHLPEIPSILEDLAWQAIEKVAQEGYHENEIEIRNVLLFLRFEGQDHCLEVEYHSDDDVEGIFKNKYTQLFGHWLTGRTIQLESVKVIASTIPQRRGSRTSSDFRYTPEPYKTTQQSYIDGNWIKIPIYKWELLHAGAAISGPAILISENSTTFIERGWNGYINRHNSFLLSQRDEAHLKRNRELHQSIQLELFTNRFKSVAEEMGALLERTAFSVNIKERLDFSCALLDAQGELVVNAPHIPVHLGSLGICVRMLKQHITMQEGDVIITNHPAFGGSHLPDITLVAPIFYEGAQIGYVANRAHHAELGGSTPGSMPPNANNLEQEGVVISPMHLVKGGKPNWDKIKEVLTQAPFPTRNFDENLADLNAALASINAGTRATLALCQQFSAHQVIHYMKALKNYAAEALHTKLNSLQAKTFEAEEKLDGGETIKVTISLLDDEVTIDFSGSSEMHVGNLNATPAIVNSAVVYVLRLLVDKELPLNEGLIQGVRIILPPSSLLNPKFDQEPANCPAVVGGNTETSQRIVDTLLKALDLAACSQGTMNNLLFGNDQFGYYETIGGGSGAGAGFHGSDAVHQHMTNTKITDPEIMEFRYPVRLERFAIRQGSGGSGKWQGGNGIIRELTFLQSVSMTVLSQHREVSPYGLHGGEGGARGKQWVVRKDGATEFLQGIDGKDMAPGDRIIIETPGGGGYGAAD
ncbi:MAG: hydantoinase B/oxoprolinase family protein [Flammeovirgaceae bacterium]